MTAQNKSVWAALIMTSVLAAIYEYYLWDYRCFIVKIVSGRNLIYVHPYIKVTVSCSFQEQ